MARRTVVFPSARTAALVLLVLVILPVVGAARAPVAMAPQLDDHLAQVERDWNVTTVIPPYRMDVLGTPREGDIEVAYRFHNDIAALEGTITRPRPSTGQPHVIYNSGMRLDAVHLSPALEPNQTARVERIYPAALDWSALQRVAAGSDVQRFAAWAAVPQPDANGDAPPRNGSTPLEGDDGAPLAWMVWTLALSNTTRDDPHTVVMSPANVRFGYHLFVDVSLSADPVRQNATSTMHFDFGGQSEGRAIAGPAPLQTDGIYLNRSHVYGMVRLVDRVHAAGQTERVPQGEQVPLSVVYESARFTQPSRDETRTLISPIELNATHALLRSNTTTGALAGSPSVDGRDIIGYRLDGEFGYQRHAVGAEQDTEAPSPGPDDDRDSPALLWVPSVLVLVAIALVLRDRRGR